MVSVKLEAYFDSGIFIQEGERPTGLTLIEIIGVIGSVCHIISRIEAEILDIKLSIEVEDVEESVKSFFGHGSAMDLTVSLTKRSFRITRRAYVLLEEAWALKLNKFAHI